MTYFCPPDSPFPGPNCFLLSSYTRVQDVFEKRPPATTTTTTTMTKSSAFRVYSLDEPDTKNVRRPPAIAPASRTTTIGHLRPAASVEIWPSSLVSTRQPLTFKKLPASAAFQNNLGQSQKSPRPQSPGVDGRSLFCHPLFFHDQKKGFGGKRSAAHVRCELGDGQELEVQQRNRRANNNGNPLVGSTSMKTSTPNDANLRAIPRTPAAATRFNFPPAFGQSVNAESTIDERDGNVKLPPSFNESFNSVNSVIVSQQSFQK